MFFEYLRYIFLCVFFFIYINTSYGWGQKGHRVIADIAFKNLSSKVKKNIQGYNLSRSLFIDKSNFPDDIKGDTSKKYIKYPEWHHLSIQDDNLSKNQLRDLLLSEKDTNAYMGILHFIECLETNKKDTFALSFLIHLVGDMHQPLHLGRPSDLRGDLIKVFWFGKETNLHTIWDENLVEQTGYSYSELSDMINSIYNNKYSDEDKLNNENLSENLIDWAYDVYNKRNFVYSSYSYILENKYSHSYAYYYYNRETINNQLYKAGMRLAFILNYLYK